MTDEESPGVIERYLPFELAFGDRLFLGVATFIFIHLAWLRYVGQDTIMVASLIGLFVVFAVYRWG